MDTPVCVFAKPPQPGTVKTRLASELGAHRAAALAEAMFCDVWNVVSRCAGATPVLATTGSGAFPITIPPRNIWLQGEGDLGTRLERIVTSALRRATAVIAVGADTPLFTSAHLHQALSMVEGQDAVIGASPDGGFYLIGLRRCPAGLFAGLPWSVSETYAAMRLRLEEHQFSVGDIGPLADVDTYSDLDGLAAGLRADPEVAPATRGWMRANYAGFF